MALARAVNHSKKETRMATYGKKSGDKVEKAMHERKAGTLKSGRSGKKVTSRKQAIAIGLSEAREEGGKVPPAKKSAAKKSSASRKSPARKSTAAKKAPAKKSTARKTTAAKKAPARKTSAAKKAPAKKSPARKTTAAKKAPAKKAARKTTKKSS